LAQEKGEKENLNLGAVTGYQTVVERSSNA